MATEAPSSQPPPETATSSSNETNKNNAAEPSSQPPPHPSSSDPPSADPPPPASPPLPPRHTATTPGPRAQRLQDMFDKTLARTLSRISPDNFASCYPTVAARAPHVLRQVQRGMVDRLGQLCGAEFAKILERYAVVARLNELEGLAGDAERRGRGRRGGEEGGGKRPVPPHLLPAGAVLAAHLAPLLAVQQGQMNARLQNMQAANVAVWNEIQAQRAEVEGLLASLEAALADVDGAAALMESVPAEELAQESMALDAEMADV